MRSSFLIAQINRLKGIGMIQYFGYPKCSTCLKAKKLLNHSGLEYEEFDISTTPPSTSLLKDFMSKGEYQIRDLFNRSGQLYRSMNMIKKMNQLSEKQLLKLLSQNGMLVKRPMIANGQRFSVGLDEQRIQKILDVEP